MTPPGLVLVSAISSWMLFACTDGCDHDDVRHEGQHRDRREVLLEAVGELLVERGGDRVMRPHPRAACSRPGLRVRRASRRVCRRRRPRLSMITGCLSASESFCAMGRVMRSVVPPAGKGTMMVMVLFGHV